MPTMVIIKSESNGNLSFTLSDGSPLKGGRLSACDGPLVQLCGLFYDNKWDQRKAASLLKLAGYHSKTGNELTNSQLSNFLRKDLGLRYVAKYKKPRYKGLNWRAFI